MTVENLKISVSTNADKAAKKLNTLSEAMDKLDSTAKSIVGTGSGTSKAISKVGHAAQKTQKPLGNFLNSLKRIAFYRFIRGIIKSITQAFSEGLQWAYQFSAGIDGQGSRFAAAMDRMKSASTQMKAQLGSAFIGLLAAIEPIIVRIIALITMAVNALAQFFAAFTGTSYLKANAVADKFADNMQRGAGAAKEWRNQLLGFDEINRLNEPSGGGGGGASGIDPSTLFSDTPLDDWAMKIHDNLAAIEAAAGGFALALGLILTLSGANIPLGLGLIAVGALTLAHSLTENWGTVDSNVAKCISNIMMILGGALLAVGAILFFATPAFSGLGLGLMAAGAASMATGAVINWNTAEDKVGSTVGKIGLILGASLLAVGAVLAFSGAATPLGIGLMIAGAASLATGASALNWDKLPQSVRTVLVLITTVAGCFVLAIGLVLALSGIDFPLGFALMAAGGAALGVGIKSVDWDYVKKQIQNAFQGIKDWWAQNVAKYFTFGYWQEKINAINPDFGAIFGGLIRWCQNAHAWIQDVINGLNILGNANSSNWQTGLTSEDFLQGFASGGFPSDGQLFIANEAGPELVGTMGGHSAVANNSQIVEGIRQGVYDAVVAANSNGGGDVSVKVFLDSKEIRAGQERLARAWG